MKENAASILESIIKGDRIILGKAMTLAESDLPSDRELAVDLLARCEKHLAGNDSTIRFAISGAPGAGKSTLIEVIGKRAMKDGHRVGVITIDPTSTISQGSILGDKARMPSLSLSPDAFIRSSPAGSLLGGIGRRSMELMTLLAAAGYDMIFLETVGVGQSEHIAWQLTDGFVLVIQPGSGDELQGIKRGITELADIIVVNKADTSLKEAAALSKSHFQNAIHYFSPLRDGWEAKVLTTSATENKGIDELWEILRLYQQSRILHDEVTEERARQNKFWLSWSLEITAHRLLLDHPDVNQKLTEGLNYIERNEKSKFTTELEIEKVMRDLINRSDLNQK